MSKKTTLKEFLAGQPLRYKGFKGRTHFAIYDKDVGISITRKDKPVGIADVRQRKMATAFYHNVTRRNPSADAEEGVDSDD